MITLQLCNTLKTYDGSYNDTCTHYMFQKERCKLHFPIYFPGAGFLCLFLFKKYTPGAILKTHVQIGGRKWETATTMTALPIRFAGPKGANAPGMSGHLKL